MAVRNRIKGIDFVKDGKGYDTYDQRVDAAYKFASEFAVVRSRPELERAPCPPPIDRYDRLTAMKRERFMACVQRAAFRQTTTGHHMACVRFVDLKDQVKALSWEGPSGMRAKDARTDSEHRYFVMRNWTTQVEERGFALLGCNLTLYAGKTKELAGVRVCPATWVSQDYGCTLKTNRGYIATNGEYSSHGDTAEDVAERVNDYQRLP
jgi:hypothetical protein